MKRLTPLKSDPEVSESEMKEAFGDVGPWLERYKDEVVQPLIHNVLAELKAKNQKIGESLKTLSTNRSKDLLGVVGFCWGARQAILLGNKSSGAG